MTNNYINVVVLGNFNPSILTHDFLVTECGFNLGDKPTKENLPMPVVASLDYDSFSFFADLGRLQITEKECENPKRSKLPNYLDIYLKKLPHTPITKCGANFSYNVDIQETKLNNIEQNLSNNRQYFCKALDAAEIQIEVIFDISDKAETVKRWILRTIAQSGESNTTMDVQRMGKSNVRIDFNYEINLEKNREQVKKITNDYAKVHDLFLFQFRNIFEKNKS
jgi:hypothetical protein